MGDNCDPTNLPVDANGMDLNDKLSLGTPQNKPSSKTYSDKYETNNVDNKSNVSILKDSSSTDSFRKKFINSFERVNDSNELPASTQKN